MSLTILQLSVKYLLSTKTLRAAAQRGAFPAIKPSRDYFVDDTTSEFLAWLAARPGQSRVIGEARRQNMFAGSGSGSEEGKEDNNVER